MFPFNITFSVDGFKNTRLPDAVTGSAVAPAALHLTETCNAALFPTEATARPVNKLHMWFRIDRKMQEQTHHLPVCEYTRLSRTYRTHSQGLVLWLLQLRNSVSLDRWSATFSKRRGNCWHVSKRERGIRI